MKTVKRLIADRIACSIEIHSVSNRFAPGLLLIAIVSPICTTCTTVWRTELTSIESIRSVPTDAPFLKAHTIESRVYVLKNWRIEHPAQMIVGTGLLYDASRHEAIEGEFRVPFGQITLVETNYPESVVLPHMVVLGVVSGISLLVTAICLGSLPKGCFGSCPTFYAHDGEKMTLQAEGFSASIAKVLEATDVDALYAAKIVSRDFELEMTNEALETHAVEHVRLLAAPRAAGSRVLRNGDEFLSVSSFRAPLSCTSDQGSSCADAVRAIDELEYRSPASEEDLASKEILELDLPELEGPLGLVIGARNTLMTTFLFYQALAWMGPDQGRWFAALENGGPDNVPRLFRDRPLGDIEVSALVDGRWIEAGAFREDGPIARELQLIRLPKSANKLRLRMTRGFWKLDYVAAVQVGSNVEPVFLDPIRVSREGVEDRDAQQRLLAPGSYLITYPSEAYTLHFQLPEGDHELFVESRGYYYEWARESWFGEEDPAALLGLLADPRGTFKTLAPKYKDVEGELEDLFWKSRVGRGNKIHRQGEQQ